MPEEDFKTLIDKIVEIIQQKGSATIEEIAQTLALEESRVEKLALLLEESGLINIRYSFLFPNKTILIAKDSKKPKNASAQESKIQRILDQVSEDMILSEKTFLICESPMLDKLKEAED
ncbi:hypothetical protein HY570_00565, partial [Candidatus Micrarchaeota archaeon]|nr:hypothetical protein [Candidatus Micrarchaeota archaeon]